MPRKGAQLKGIGRCSIFMYHDVGRPRPTPCSLIILNALKTMKVETIPYEWMDEIAVR